MTQSASSQPPSPQQLQKLIDQGAIQQLLFDYCHAVDRCDGEALAATFHEDGFDDHGVFTGSARDFVKWVIPFLLENTLSTTHPITNIRLRIEGDVAFSECYVAPVLRRKEGNNEILDCSGGRYIDRIERRNGVWKIAHRTFVREWRESRTVPPTGNASDKYRWGVRSREDLSYR